MHIPLRFRISAVFLLAGLSIGPGSTAWAQPDETAAQPAQDAGEAEQQPAEPSQDQQPSGFVRAMRQAEKRIDEAAGVVVEAIASVMFYELWDESATATADADAIDIRDKEDIRRLIEEIDRKGVDVWEVDFTLSVPHGMLTEEEAEQLRKAYAPEFTKLQRKFEIEVREESAGDPDVVRLVAKQPGVKLIVIWLVFGATFFTIRMGFINVRAFKHGILVTAGRYDNPDDPGEVSHLQALSAALSATVGLGNIAGVAIAISLGGPGATFWMIIAGLLGMSTKFTECTLGQLYRKVRPDGRILGGPMDYLPQGFREMKLGPLGVALGVLFAILCIGGSFGGGNAFQVSQSLDAVQENFDFLKEGWGWTYGLLMVVLVGMVIIGGIRRIAATAEKIVPAMCVFYVLACLSILLMYASQVPAAMATIVTDAFTPRAGYGGLVGVLVVGFQRAAFSNEAGIGSAAIAHSAARTEYPVREGIVASLGPFIDTVVVCTMTALVIVITGAYEKEAYRDLIDNEEGAALTSQAMGEAVEWFPYMLSIAVVLFAYSTMISWSYYGERCWVWLFGDRTSMVYRVLFLVFVFLGSIVSATNIRIFGDLMILGMAFPNILGVLLLSGRVKKALNEYWGLYKAGKLEIDQTKAQAQPAEVPSPDVETNPPKSN